MGLGVQNRTGAVGRVMTTRRVTIPEPILIAGTRAAFGTGVGLLIVGEFSNDARRAAGWALAGVGAGGFDHN